MNKKKSLITALLLVVVAGLSITAGTFAYFQWTTGVEGGTQVNVTIEMGGITMHIEPEQTEFVGLYPTAHCENNVRYGDALVTIVNNTGTLAIPSFKLKLKITPSVADTGTLEYYREHVHYSVVALETSTDAHGKPIKGDGLFGGVNLEYEINDGSCNFPLSVWDGSEMYWEDLGGSLDDDTFKSDYGKGATGNFQVITQENTFASTNFLPREYNFKQRQSSGVTFRGESYSTSYQYYRVFVWVDDDYTSTIIGDDVTDPLQNAKIEVTWSEESMIQQVSGVSNSSVYEYPLAGWYSDDDYRELDWFDTLEVGVLNVDGTTIVDSSRNSDNVVVGYGKVVVEEGITAVGEYAFGASDDNSRNSTGLKKLTLPSSMEEIGYKAFFRVNLLEKLEFHPEAHLRVIGDYAFANSKIKTIELPTNIDYIGEGAFSNVEGTNIFYIGTLEEWNAITKGNNWNEGCTNVRIICSDGSITL